MKSNDDIVSLMENLNKANLQAMAADTTYLAALSDVRAAFQERAETLVDALKTAGKEPTVLRNRSTQITGWVLVHHPATPERLEWPKMSDGYMLVVDRDWTFWLVYREPSDHNPEIELTGTIKRLKLDHPTRIDLLWTLLKPAVPAQEEQS